MFVSILFQRTFPLKIAPKKHLYLALPHLMFVQKYSVKQLCCTLNTKKNFCKEVNSSSFRGIHANKYCSKEANGKNTSEVSELLNNINLDIKSFQRVKYKDAEMILHFIKKGLIVEHDKYALLLLQWCSNLMPDVDNFSRISFAQSTWNVLKNLGTEIGTNHYNALLRCYVANSHRVLVSKFLADMNEVVPDSTTYELLLECTCAVGDVEQATHVIQLMKDKNISISETTFNSLILGHARAGDIKSSLLTLDTMYAANLLPSANTYTAVLQSCAEFGDIKQMKKIYEEASRTIHFNIHQVMSICKILALRQHQKIILEFLELLPDDLKKLTSVVQNTIIELVHLKCEEGALSIMISVLPETSYSSDHPSAFFIFEMCRANIESVNIINICNYLEKNEIYPRALYKAAEASLHLNKPDLTLHIFKTLVQNGAVLRPHYFWPLFRQRAKTEGETGIVSALKDMQTLKVIPDFHTLIDYVLPMISTNDPETTVQKLQACGVSVRQSLTPIAAILLRTGKQHSLLQLCKSYPSKLDFEKLLQPLVETFLASKNARIVASFLEAASKHTKNDIAGHFLLELLTVKNARFKGNDIIKLLQSFKDENLSISVFASNVLTQYFMNGGKDSTFSEKGTALLAVVKQNDLHIPSAETSLHIAHPRDMNTEELECHLVELKNKNMNTRGVLRHLLLSLVRDRNVQRLLEVKKELEDSGFQFSSGMQASLFAMYIQSKDSVAAGKCLNEIMHKYPDFVVDVHKIINYATLLVTENQYKAAVAVLERRAVNGDISCGEKVSFNCWQLLNSLALQGEVKKVKHMLRLLRTLGFCSVTNALLGPLVRSHLVRGDTDGAVREYQDCVTTFRMTPLQLELLSHLVEKPSDSQSSQKLIEDVLAATVSVHGESKTFVTYIVALAEKGEKKKLQNFIAENGTKLHYATLIYQVKRLAKEGKIFPLLILADICDNLHNFDSSLLFTSILQVYDKLGDCDGALNLWTTMQEKNVQPSQEFLESLQSILRSHNRTIPLISSNT